MSHSKEIVDTLLSYAKGHYGQYARRDLLPDLAVIMGHHYLMEPTYFTDSKKGQEDLIRLLASSYYDLRGGKIAEREFIDIILAPYHWLGDAMVERLIGIFSNELMREGDVVIRELPEINQELNRKLELARAIRTIEETSKIKNGESAEPQGSHDFDKGRQEQVDKAH